jgi:hypothetical protein
MPLRQLDQTSRPRQRRRWRRHLLCIRTRTRTRPKREYRNCQTPTSRIDEIIEIVEIPEPQDGPCSFVNEISDLLKGTKFSTNMDRIELLGLNLSDRHPLNLPTGSFRHPSLHIRYLHRLFQFLDPASSLFDTSNKLRLCGLQGTQCYHHEKSISTTMDTNLPQLSSMFNSLSVPARGGGTTDNICGPPSRPYN